jgi:hypothetical protein
VVISYTYERQEFDGLAIPGTERLSRVEIADGTDIVSEGYVYEDARFRHALTGIVDGNGERFATWSYDDELRVTTSEHGGGVQRTTQITFISGLSIRVRARPPMNSETWRDPLRRALLADRSSRGRSPGRDGAPAPQLPV